MNEYIAARKIIEEAEKEGDVRGVSVIVGELAPVTSTELSAALSKAKPGWKVQVETRKSQVACACGYKGEPKITGREEEIPLFECPKCGKEPHIMVGEEIVLEQVTLKEAEKQVAEEKRGKVGKKE
ncbi:MAG: hydrogenase/urease maturation nickel metallochaperone HypA [Nanoarchaeota archaeon]